MTDPSVTSKSFRPPLNPSYISPLTSAKKLSPNDPSPLRRSLLPATTPTPNRHPNTRPCSRAPKHITPLARR
jgi:hypothetical protein